jgi:hypothetical protein
VPATLKIGDESGAVLLVVYLSASIDKHGQNGWEGETSKLLLNVFETVA